jgi:hypothetical protein
MCYLRRASGWTEQVKQQGPAADNQPVTLGRQECRGACANASALILLSVALSIFLSACGGTAIAKGSLASCTSLARCVALVNSIDETKHLLLPHPDGEVADGGWVDHGHFEQGWNILVNYRSRTHHPAFTFSAEPASDVKQWCTSPNVTTSTTVTATGRLACLALFGTYGWAAFVSSGVRYDVSLPYEPAARPAPGVLKANLLSLIDSIR